LAELEIGADGSLAGFGNQAPGSTPLVSGSTTPGGWHKLGLETDYNTNLSRFFVDVRGATIKGDCIFHTFPYNV
jgi:hypothetical protein